MADPRWRTFTDVPSHNDFIHVTNDNKSVSTHHNFTYQKS